MSRKGCVDRKEEEFLNLRSRIILTDSRYLTDVKGGKSGKRGGDGRKSFVFRELNFMMGLMLQNVDPLDLLYMPDNTFLAYLPLISSYIRNQTQHLNTISYSLFSEFYHQHWSTTVAVVLHRIHSNPNIGKFFNFFSPTKKKKKKKKKKSTLR
eukprot:TRINITY_DN22867_c0_g1_i1.p1 TRINITY_DN22867_c0_g1~~TRINITY_DN22867_c0_g1_i1.p1  ORF type:complete len:153 (+),score=37.08 TRINITY_DN22867_c0_g1_i1:81-539(+)